MNGGGRIEREYGLGHGRTDLLVRWPREPGRPSDLRERCTAHRPVPPRAGEGALARRANLRAVDAQFLTIIGTVLAVGFGLAGLMIRTTARLDRRIDNDKAAADADRRAYQTAADADRRAFQAGMDAFRAEMQRLAERRSHVEVMVAERGAAAG